jgi:hypothetical protein
MGFAQLAVVVGTVCGTAPDVCLHTYAYSYNRKTEREREREGSDYGSKGSAMFV